MHFNVILPSFAAIQFMFKPDASMFCRSIHVLNFLLFCCLFISCKKTETPPIIPQEIKIVIKQSEIALKNEELFLGRRIEYVIQNLTAGANDSVLFSIENPRIATVDTRGNVWPQAAGTTYAYVNLFEGKASAKIKVVVTDANGYKLRIVLNDKGNSKFNINQPEQFLSAKSISRRKNQNIPVDALDLPISIAYLKEIEAIGGKIVTKSKWLNSVVVYCDDQFLIDQYLALPFVKEVKKVWRGRKNSGPQVAYIDFPQIVSNHTSQTQFDYGVATKQISVNNGQVLHQNGYKGAGIDIAVLDMGFPDLQKNEAFKNVNVKGAKSFVYENNDPYATGYHGLDVTSCMAVNLPGKYVGTAPEANYWLFRTEDEASEFPVEEDYWVAAAEYADSAGVDIINSSLYYATSYSIDYGRYKYEDMDGKTAVSSRGANVAAGKGILIFNCAGNDQSWVGAPADAPGVISVGSVNDKLQAATSTSFGITVDGRMKPDVMAFGTYCAVYTTNGVLKYTSGTSFASPIICGLAACLWQAYPKLTAADLREVLRKSADRAGQPVVPFGFGVPDMQRAMILCAALDAGKRK